MSRFFLRGWARWILGGGDTEASPPAPGPTVKPDDDAAPWGEPVTVPIEDFIDLHTFRAKEARDVTRSYLEAAHEAGFREVRVIHGKGTGTLRRSIQSLLSRHPLVERFEDAPPHRGGWGATVVWLVSEEPSI